MEREFIRSMAINTLANFSMVPRMEWEFTLLLMEANTKDNSKTMSLMVKVCRTENFQEKKFKIHFFFF